MKFSPKFHLIILFLAFYATITTAQDLKSTVFTLMEDTRNNRPAKTEKLNFFLIKEPENVVKAVYPYLSDSASEVRLLAVNLFGRSGKTITTRAVRQEIVSNLVNACDDKSSKVSAEAVSRLKYFKKEDFTDQAGSKIISLIQKREILDKTFIKIAGVASPQGLDMALNQLLSDSTIKKRDFKWNVQLTLARFGNKAAAEYCVKFVKDLGVNDAVIYELFPDLIYTRTYEAINFLITVLNSDDKNCKSSNPDSNEKIACGYRVMEYLAPVIVDYPLKTTASGDIKTDDYPQSLKLVREWFAKQNGRYIIDNSSF